MKNIVDFNHNIKGLYILNNFITNDEESNILNYIYQNIWDDTIKRRTQHYGLKFEYKYRKIEDESSVNNFPKWLSELVNKLRENEHLKDFNPNQCTINEYTPGAGIAPHIDTHSCFSDTIVSLSLESPITMRFVNKDITNLDTDNCLYGVEKDLYILPKSLLIMKDDARYCYTHGIASRTTDQVNNRILRREKRVSITFREVVKTECNCKWNLLCDSQDGKLEKTRLLKKI